MPRPRRRYVHNSAYFITARSSEGLPFVSCMLIRVLMFGIIARAKSLYPAVKICAWLFMGNHFHAILVNKGDSEAIPDFMEFVDGEIAKAMNRLRGRRNFSFWGDRYHAEELITAGAVVKKMAYIYLNPARANLVDTIAAYPGVSTWREFMGHAPKSYCYYGSSLLGKLPKGSLSLGLCKKVLAKYRENAKSLPKHQLTLEPFAWLDCFEESKNWEESKVKKEILKLISLEEVYLLKDRAKKNRNVLGKEALQNQCFFKRFQTSNFSPRSLCISTCEIARENFIAGYREFCSACKACWELSCSGLFDIVYPPGAFRPGCRPRGTLLGET